MLWNLDAMWLAMSVTSVLIVAFFLGSAIRAIMREDGFGATVNMIIIAAGFFLAILAVNGHGHYLRDLQEAVMIGLAGAFASLGTLTLIKVLTTRF